MDKLHVEKVFEYKGCTCVVILQPLGHRCGYVGVPRGNAYYGRRGRELYSIMCHGGVTYADDHLPQEHSDGLWWIGFDCMHHMDAPDVATVRIAYGDELAERAERCRIHGYDDWLIIRTLEYCEGQCRDMVDQMTWMEGENNGNEAAEEKA